MTQERIFKTPIGNVKACATTDGLRALHFTESPERNEQDSKRSSHLLNSVEAQVQKYFCGTLKVFNIPLDVNGTKFQKDVWQTLKEVPYGSTITYKQQSEFLNNPLAIRAMAAANAKNPLLIIIPCHRIIGSNGRLTGYAGGLERKRKLLMLEQEHSGKAGLFNA